MSYNQSDIESILLGGTPFIYPQTIVSNNPMMMSPPAQLVPQLENFSFSPYEYMQNGPMPYLKIIEQPLEMFRFRYKSEMSGTHGCILGRSRKKSYPTAQLVNYFDEAKIVCSLVQVGDDHDFHPHKLVLWRGNQEIEDPHEISVGPEKGFVASFMGLSILYTDKKSRVEELVKKKIKEMERYGSRNLEKIDRAKIQMEYMNISNNINLNSVCLKFVAYDKLNRIICKPIYSLPIDNSKSAETGQLKIVNISKVTGSVYGGEAVLIFVEKVNKKNIKVRFFEVKNNVRVWEAFASFTELDVHHQFGICFKTPPYKDVNVDTDVNVFIELYRPKDQATSEEIPFQYKASFNHSKKRRHDSEAVVNVELPTTVLNLSGPVLPNFIENVVHEKKSLACQSTMFSTNEAINNIQSQVELWDFDLESYINDAQEFKTIENIESILPDYFANLKNVVFDSPEVKGKYFSMSTNVKKLSEFNFTISICDKLMEKIRSEISGEDFIYLKKFIKFCEEWNQSKYSESNMKKLYEVLNQPLENDEQLLHIFVTYDLIDCFQSVLNFITHAKWQDLLKSVNNRDETVLHKAVKLGQVKIIKMLSEAGVNPNSYDDNGNTPLHLSVLSNNYDCVMALNDLFMSSIDLNVLNCEGLTPLHLSIVQKNSTMAKYLVSRGSSISICTSRERKTPLHLSVETANLELVKYFVDLKQLYIDYCNLQGYTALHYACTLQDEVDYEICEYLLSNGADPFIKCNNVSSPWKLAQRNYKIKITDLMKKYAKGGNLKESDESSSSEDEYEHIDSNLFDCVIESLDSSGKWMDIIEEIDVKWLFSVCDQASSPSRVLLNYIKFEEKIKPREFCKLLEKTEALEAVAVFKNHLEFQ